MSIGRGGVSISGGSMDSMVHWGMVDNWGSMVDNRGSMMDNWGSMYSMGNNWGMVDSMGNWGSMVNSVSSSMCNSTKVGESCECHIRGCCSQGNQSNQGKSL